MKQALNEVIGMDMNFHVKSYQQLFDSLQKNVKTVDDLIRLLQDQMQKVARVFSLGKFELRFYAAKSVMDPNGQDDCYLIYESEKGFDAPPCEEKVTFIRKRIPHGHSPRRKCSSSCLTRSF